MFFKDYLLLVYNNITLKLISFYKENKYSNHRDYFKQFKLTNDIELDSISGIIEEQYEQAHQLEMPKNHIYALGLSDSPSTRIQSKRYGSIFFVDALSGFDFNIELNIITDFFHFSRLYNGHSAALNEKFTSEPLLLTDSEAVKDWMKDFDQFTSDFAKECLKELTDNVDYYFYEFYRNLAE
jgi:hypothetical protein